jgi:hypothetical protein
MITTLGHGARKFDNGPDSVQQRDAWCGGGVCHRPNVDGSDDIFRNVWSSGPFRQGMVDFEHRRQIAGGHRQSRPARFTMSITDKSITVMPMLYAVSATAGSKSFTKA